MIFSRFSFVALVLTASWTVFSCGEKDESKNEKTSNAEDSLRQEKLEEKPKEAPFFVLEKRVNKDLDPLASFLAGQPQTETNTYQGYQENKAWKSYQAKAEQLWSKNKKAKFETMRNWAKQELAAPNAAGGLLFYPFSGADFIHADLFFPDADQYLLIGLEPIGSLPNMEQIQKTALGPYLNSIERAMHYLLSLSFFRTKSMEVDLTGKVNKHLDGTLPLLMVFMKRFDNEVLYYERVAVSAEGKLIAEEAYQKPVGKDTTIYGTKLTLRRKGEEKIRTLYYFSADLSNAGLQKRPDFTAFLNNLRPKSVYIKSASYLMYKEYFANIRNIVLQHTPLKYFSKVDWDIQLYGAYSRPIDLFKNYYQKDLHNLYQGKDKDYSPKPLPFGIGYQYREGTSNLMLAVRKKR